MSYAEAVMNLGVKWRGGRIHLSALSHLSSCGVDEQLKGAVAEKTNQMSRKGTMHIGHQEMALTRYRRYIVAAWTSQRVDIDCETTYGI